MQIAAQHARPARAVFGAWIWVVVSVALTALPAYAGTPKLAAPMVPEAVRLHPAAEPLRNDLQITTLAPGEQPGLPNLEMLPPPKHTLQMMFGPTLLKREEPYRGESFGSDYSSNPGREDRHIPLPGIALKVPLY